MTNPENLNEYRSEGSTYTGASFSVKNRMARFLWDFTYHLFFRPSPRPFHAWRAMLLRLFGAKLGKHCHICPRAKIWAPWNLICDEEVCVADDVIIYNQAPVRFGQRVVISQGAHLCAGTHDYSSPGFELIARPIRIEDNVWIAAEAFIHPGIDIAEGCVIGARAVVTRNMPAWKVCAGHPCKPLKARIRMDIKNS